MAQQDERDVTRRGFLQTAGGALLTGSALAAAGAAADAEAQVPNLKLPPVPGKKLGFALVGLGSLSINQIMPAFPKCERAKLTGVVSGRPEKAKLLAQRYGVPEKNIYTYENFDTIAHNPEIDIVYVVLPNSMHAEYTIRALKAGKHVLCEKPMANTPQECEQMIAAAKAANRKLAIGYRVRYEPNNQAMIKLARDQELGPARVILADAGFSIGDPAQWRLRRAMAGGGSLMDIGIYALNAARYLSGEEPTDVHAMIHTTPNDVRFVEVEETVTFQLRFPSGVLANCTSSYGCNVNRFRVIATKGSFELEPASGYGGIQMRVLRGGNVVETRPQPVIDHFAAEMDALAACVMNNTDSVTPGEEGLRDLRIMMAIYESAKIGRPVKLTAS
jgi:glucose-fructose oxidoreductase